MLESLWSATYVPSVPLNDNNRAVTARDLKPQPDNFTAWRKDSFLRTNPAERK